MTVAILVLVVLLLVGFVSVFPKLTSTLRSTVLKTSTSTATVERSTPEDLGAYTKSELCGVFGTFDLNGDGFITSQELRASLEKVGILMSEEEVGEVMTNVDSNGDGLIDFEEFCVLCETLWSLVKRGSCSQGSAKGMSTEMMEEQDLRDAFDVFDKDKDGLISGEELGSVLCSLGLNEGRTSEDCNEIIKMVDQDGDGMVNFDEFKHMMTRKQRGP